MNSLQAILASLLFSLCLGQTPTENFDFTSGAIVSFESFQDGSTRYFLTADLINNQVMVEEYEKGWKFALKATFMVEAGLSKEPGTISIRTV